MWCQPVRSLAWGVAGHEVVAHPLELHPTDGQPGHATSAQQLIQHQHGCSKVVPVLGLKLDNAGQSEVPVAESFPDFNEAGLNILLNPDAWFKGA